MRDKNNDDLPCDKCGVRGLHYCTEGQSPKTFMNTPQQPTEQINIDDLIERSQYGDPNNDTPDEAFARELGKSLASQQQNIEKVKRFMKCGASCFDVYDGCQCGLEDFLKELEKK